VARTAISKNTHSPTLSRKTTRPDRSPALVIQTAASGTEAQSSWYSGPTAKRKLETFCTEAYQTGKPVDLFGDVDNPLLQIRSIPTGATAFPKFERMRCSTAKSAL
jgi:hypothetical protein